MVKEAPPSRDAVTTSLVCFALGLVKIFVASGISAAPRVPQDIIIDNTSQRFPCVPKSQRLTEKVIIIDKIEVIQTRFVNGASKSNLSHFLE